MMVQGFVCGGWVNQALHAPTFTGRYGVKPYWQTKGQNEAILNAVSLTVSSRSFGTIEGAGYSSDMGALLLLAPPVSACSALSTRVLPHPPPCSVPAFASLVQHMLVAAEG